MKKIFVISALLAVSFVTVNAQDDKNIFDHLGAGLSVGTDGIDFELATPITNYLALRAGVSFLPTIKVSDIKVDVSGQQSTWKEGQTKVKEFKEKYYNYLSSADKSRVDNFCNDSKFLTTDLPSDVLVDGKLSMFNWKVLFDVYPFKKSDFRITAGFYCGKSQIIEAYTTNCQDNFNALTAFNQNLAGTEMKAIDPNTHQTLSSYTFHEKYGLKMGDYLLEPNGNQVKANLKTSSFKPYVGIGYGRAIPSKHRLAFNFDLGVMFWGTPKVYAEQPSGDVQIEKGSIEGDGGIIKTISKVTVYPCLSFRLSGRLF